MSWNFLRKMEPGLVMALCHHSKDPCGMQAGAEPCSLDMRSLECSRGIPAPSHHEGLQILGPFHEGKRLEKIRFSPQNSAFELPYPQNHGIFPAGNPHRDHPVQPCRDWGLFGFGLGPFLGKGWAQPQKPKQSPNV